jgi:CRP-like cAMP-binding protein
VVEWAVLAGLPPDERRRVLGVGRPRRFAAGETVFHEGDPADSLHLLRSGLVAVRVTTPQGDQAVLTVLTPGQAFGELALLQDNGHRTATVTALEPSETIALHRTEFDRLRVRHPSVDSVLLAALSGQVTRLSEHLLEVLFVPARTRILRRLLTLAKASDDGVVRLTQEDLARMSGTTRATVNEVLRDAERAGAVRIGRRRIEVADRPWLLHRAR